MTTPAQTASTPKAQPKGTKPGIYFGMSNDDYHADPALGSTMLRKLANNPCDFWWGSNMNPAKEPEKMTPARIRGSAMHTLVLEGQAEFDKQYMCGARQSPDMTASEKGAATKAANAKAAALGLTALPEDDFDRVVIAAAMISKNPKLSGAFQGGAPEVSVFWEQDGLMFKIRIDYLKARGIGDLKSITNTKEKPFADAVHDAIANYRYDTAGAHYLNGRAQMPALIKAGLVFSPNAPILVNHYAKLLEQVAAAKSFAFQWVFFAADKAPLTHSKILSPNNPMVSYGMDEIRRGVANYRKFMELYGPDTMWLEVDEPTELNVDDMPSWFGRSRRV